jgi:hypothetical protein
VNKLLKVFGVGVLVTSIVISGVGCVKKEEVKPQSHPLKQQQQLQEDTECCS